MKGIVLLEDARQDTLTLIFDGLAATRLPAITQPSTLARMVKTAAAVRANVAAYLRLVNRAVHPK